MLSFVREWDKVLKVLNRSELEKQKKEEKKRKEKKEGTECV